MIELGATDEEFKRFARELRRHADGKELRKELALRVRKALDPARDKARSDIMGMRSLGTRVGPPLRASVARATITEVRVEGALAGGRLKAKDRPMPRGFRNAPKRLNSRRGWRHPVFGRKAVWVAQRGQQGWFTDAVKQGEAAYRKAVKAAMDDLAARIRNRMG